MFKASVLIVLICFVCGIYGGVVKATNFWLPCVDTPTLGKALAVAVNKDTTKCVLVKGTTASFTLTFSPSEASNNMSAIVHGEVFGTDVPFPLKDPNVCNNHGVKCPVAAGKTYAYTTGIDILKIYPSMSVIVKWENKDDNSKDVICVLISCVLQ